MLGEDRTWFSHIGEQIYSGSIFFNACAAASGTLTAKAQYTLTTAETYFKEHLSAGDYYAEGKQVRGE